MQIIVDITNKVEMLNIKASDIDSYAQQSVSKISEQFASAQAKLEDELGNLVKQLMDTISASTNQSIGAVGNELTQYRVLVHDATKKFTDSSSNAITKQEGQIAGIGKLVACIQERQNFLETKIDELRQLDTVRLFDEISEIRRIESENLTAAKKWRVIELNAFGICIALGIAILIRLFVM